MSNNFFCTFYHTSVIKMHTMVFQKYPQAKEASIILTYLHSPSQYFIGYILWLWIAGSYLDLFYQFLRFQTPIADSHRSSPKDHWSKSLK